METFAHPIVGDGRATLAIRIKDDVISVGVSFCSPKDQFSKSHGRKIASNRLRTGHPDVAHSRAFFAQEPRDTNQKTAEQAVNMLNRLINGEGKAPRWTKKQTAVLKTYKKAE
jgi:hypothetical protein